MARKLLKADKIWSGKCEVWPVLVLFSLYCFHVSCLGAVSALLVGRLGLTGGLRMGQPWSFGTSQLVSASWIHGSPLALVSCVAGLNSTYAASGLELGCDDLVV